MTLGRRYSSARTSFGTVVLPEPGRAWVSLTLFSDSPRYRDDRPLWSYLDEYVRDDPRVRDVFEGARVLAGAGHRLMLRDAPLRASTHGFMGLGDALTPAGHLGILPSS